MSVQNKDAETDFEKELASAINKKSMENGSNTPDFILAKFLQRCLFAFNEASRLREKWYGRELSIGGNRTPSDKALQIAARIWCDKEMTAVVMDGDAATEIARIIDAVIESQLPSVVEPMTLGGLMGH